MVLDTSGLLAAIDSAQSRHAGARRALEQSGGPYLISPFVLAELDYLLATRVGRAERLALLEEVERESGFLGTLKDQMTALEANLAERELAAQEHRIGLAEAEKAVTAGAEKLYGLRSEIKNLEGRIELARRERDNLEESSSRSQEELSALGEQLTAAEQEARTAKEELDQLERGLAQEQAGIEEAEREVQTAQETLRGRESERDTLALRRSLWVVADVAAGEQVTADNVRSIRPAGGLHTDTIGTVLGRTFTRDVARGTPLTWDLI